jgi:hypothetical protein
VTPIFYGRIDKTGKVQFDNALAWAQHCQSLKGASVEVTCRKQRTQRSLKQNAAYWAIVVPAIADYCGYEKDEAHEALKFRFLRKGEPDALLPTSRSTTELTVQEFEDYVRQVRQFAAETLGLDIPEPSEVSL